MKTTCEVCGRLNTDIYIVHEEVWNAAGLKAEDSCCIECLSGRLGRDLNLSDFNTDAPINRLLILGYRIGRRSGESGYVPDLPLWRPKTVVTGKVIPLRKAAAQSENADRQGPGRSA